MDAATEDTDGVSSLEVACDPPLAFGSNCFVDGGTVACNGCVIGGAGLDCVTGNVCFIEDWEFIEEGVKRDSDFSIGGTCFELDKLAPVT